jgi:serine/threonine protein kinase
MKKAIKTDSRYYIFIEYCNGGDMKELMELKNWKIQPDVIQAIMQQVVTGFAAMFEKLVIHRDLKLQNLMLHFPNDSERLVKMNKEQRRKFLREVDLTQIEFEVKIADFGFSKKLKNKSDINKTVCGTPLYMAPQLVQKSSYSYKADIWSIGVILFELMNGNTPFHARDREEFEGRVEASDFNLKDSVKNMLSLECVSFMN